MEATLIAQLEEKDEWINQLEKSLAETESELTDLRERLQALEWMLEDIKASRSYRVALRCARAGARFAPSGTFPRRVLSLGARGLRSLPKLRNPRWVAHRAKMALNRGVESLGQVLRHGRIMAERLIGPLRSCTGSRFSSLRFPVHARLDVSIIVPIFNHWRETFACLESILRLTDGSAYEVIVVDDASTDETPEMMKQIEGVVYWRNDQNLGFIESCNRAATRPGASISFSSTTTPWSRQAGLKRSCRPFETFPGAGLPARSWSTAMAGFRRPAA